MLSKWFAEDPGCNLTLELFLREIQGALQERLLSVMLYGSVVFDDLAPGYGDLDFVAFLSGSLSDSEAHRLLDLRRPFRSGRYGIIAHMLEGSFLPVHMLEPGRKGRAVWWGTSGESIWYENNHGALDFKVMKERGTTIYGDDLRHIVPEFKDVDCMATVWAFLDRMQKRSRPGSLHTIDWILTSARLILWLREGKLSSKSEAADWGFVNLKGAWREELPTAKELRLHPELCETRDTKDWLGTLDAAIREAASELRDEIDVFQQMAERNRT